MSMPAASRQARRQKPPRDRAQKDQPVQRRAKRRKLAREMKVKAAGAGPRQARNGQQGNADSRQVKKHHQARLHAVQRIRLQHRKQTIHQPFLFG